jgi:hypothetical protein
MMTLSAWSFKRNNQLEVRNNGYEPKNTFLPHFLLTISLHKYRIDYTDLFQGIILNLLRFFGGNYIRTGIF